MRLVQGVEDRPDSFTINELRTALEHSNLALAEFDRQKRFLRLMGGGIKPWGPVENWIGKSLNEVHQIQGYHQGFDEALEGHENVKTSLFEGRVLQVHFVPNKRNSLGQVETVLAITDDITEHSRTEDQLHKAIRDREFFMASLSHDIKNPLSAIMTNASLIPRFVDEHMTVEKTRRVSKFVENINRDSNTILAMVDSLMEVTKMEGGTFLVSPEVIDVFSLTSRCFDVLQPIIAEAGQRLIIEHNTKARVVCDVHTISRVFSNLVGNALKFNAKGGSVQVIVQESDDWVEFIVGDEGDGIPEQQRAYVFDRYYQADRRKSGAGLGLAIAKGIVEAHRGSIWITNAKPKGSCFHFRLPKEGTVIGKELLG
jgi:signal transduction histidine kinase